MAPDYTFFQATDRYLSRLFSELIDALKDAIRRLESGEDPSLFKSVCTTENVTRIECYVKVNPNKLDLVAR